jgi:cytochrome c
LKQFSVSLVALVGLALSTAAAVAQDAEAGAAVFKKCAACHAADGVTNKVGPHLGGLIGRTAGTVPGFNYSKAMKDAGAAGLVWDEATLAEYLVAPKAKVPGTKMAFVGLKKPDEVQNVIAYLKSIEK